MRQVRRAEIQHRDISDNENDREAPATRLRSPIAGRFYQEQLTPVRVSNRTAFKLNKILDKRVRHGNRDFVVRWRGYR